MPTAVEQIMWTAVPNGIGTAATGGQVLNLSVHVSPTLSGGSTGTLTDFPDFQTWPAFVGSGRDGHIHVDFTDGSHNPLGSTTIAIDTSVLDNALWTALFNPPGSIQYMAREAYESTLTTTPVVSYPADQVASFLRNTYTNLAINSPTAYPSLDALADLYGDLGYANEDGIDELNNLWATLAGERLGEFETHVGPAPYYNDWTSATPQTALGALRFYHLVANQGLPQTAPAVALPTVDFHRALTFIGEHPTLQRALGLVFDVAVPIAVLPSLISSVNSDVYVSAWAGNSDGTQSYGGSGVTYSGVTPRTQCDASTSVFEAHPDHGPDRRPTTHARRPHLVRHLRGRRRRRRTEDRSVRRQPEIDLAAAIRRAELGERAGARRTDESGAARAAVDRSDGRRRQPRDVVRRAVEQRERDPRRRHRLDPGPRPHRRGPRQGLRPRRLRRPGQDVALDLDARRHLRRREREHLDRTDHR